jgi:hypothetical protein
VSGERVRIDLPADDCWTLFSVTRGGKPEVLFVNNALRDFEHRAIFPWHLRIWIEVVDLAEQGMPQPEEQERLYILGDEIEDTLLAAKSKFDSQNVLYLARSTWDGLRELIFRVHDPEIANRVLQEVTKSRTWDRAWGFEMEHDRDWARAVPILACYPAH